VLSSGVKCKEFFDDFFENKHIFLQAFLPIGKDREVIPKIYSNFDTIRKAVPRKSFLLMVIPSEAGSREF
jgi:hypothetical protein